MKLFKRNPEYTLSIFVTWEINTIFSFALFPLGDIQKGVRQKNSIFCTPIFTIFSYPPSDKPSSERQTAKCICVIM